MTKRRCYRCGLERPEGELERRDAFKLEDGDGGWIRASWWVCAPSATCGQAKAADELEKPPPPAAPT